MSCDRTLIFEAPNILLLYLEMHESFPSRSTPETDLPDSINARRFASTFEKTLVTNFISKFSLIRVQSSGKLSRCGSASDARRSDQTRKSLRATKPIML
jgi:hypothetical protein